MTKTQAALDNRSRVVTHAGGSVTSLSFDRTDGVERTRRNVTWKRGVVRGFSSASRRRLLRRIAGVNKLAYSHTPAFVTLTYPACFPTEPDIYKAHARALLKRVQRAYGASTVIWRLEFQRRGAPHFHMLCFGLKASDDLQAWLLRNWYEVCASGDEWHLERGADVQRLKSWRQVTVYLAKYLGKPDPKSRNKHVPVGRFWGVEGGNLLRVTPVSWTMTYAEGVRYRRTMQRYAGLFRRGAQRERGCTVFLSSEGATRIMRALRPFPHQPGEARPLPGLRTASPDSPAPMRPARPSRLTR